MKLKYRTLLFVILAVVMLLSPTVKAQNGSSEKVTRNDFKFTLLSLGSGSTRITYEHAFNPINSAEFTLGIVGLGLDFMNASNPHGLLVKLAYKWRLIPQRNADSWLAGLYVKPEFVICHFNYYDPLSDAEIVEQAANTFQMALLAEVGYQLVLNWFVFDVYTGLGPSVGSGNDNNYFHSFMLFPKESFLAFTAGFRLGVAF